MGGNACRLSVFGFGMALGLTWGLSVLALGLMNHYLGLGATIVTGLGEFYIGYEASIIGSLIGAGWGFIDMFIGGVIIAWLYNRFAGCCKK